MTCAACNAPNPGAQRFCGQCGALLAPEGHANLDATAANAETSPGPEQPRPRTPPRVEGRFLPGAMLAGRYRMVALLGRGGMGEVYRAEDVKLGQPVALKFLPAGVERDADRLDRFLGEVRLSLRVTHPNVCRVFDIGQIDDRQFLSMEYVDGEDLASLLRRIGRLPEDKAIEIARQMCAGLAAAHGEGVLHRDLKPANVMIDGRGRAKITDFGLAAATTGVSGAEARVGTPQYMAPEQLAGEALTERTDIYALGLVLYELFTGKRAFDARSFDELAQRQSSAPTNPSTHVTGLNPAVERVILRCLDPDPARRPSSASAVAASFPGGDPLAMALAAGETPSPEMVARAGGEGLMPLGAAAACLAVVIAGLVGVWFLVSQESLSTIVPLPKSPAELIVDARAAMAAAGYVSRPAGSAHGFRRDSHYFDKVSETDKTPGRWATLGSVRPRPLMFWYRESPATLVPAKDIGTVNWNDPPPFQPGMMRVELGPEGELHVWHAVPPDVDPAPPSATEPDWGKLFAAARLDLTTFTPASPLWTRPTAADTRRAWVQGDLRVEAASLHGRPVWFEVIPSWRSPQTGAPDPETTGERVAIVALSLMAGIVVLGGALMARRNIRLGRGDRRGALRLAFVLVGIGTAANLLVLPADASVWLSLMSAQFGNQLASGAMVWVFYIAVEPYVRRWWPRTLIAWSRLLEGRLRDPLVGRHILIGGVAGLAFSAYFVLTSTGTRWLGLPPLPPSAALKALAGTRFLAAEYLYMIEESFAIPVGALLAVLLARVVLRKPWIAYTVLTLIMCGLGALAGGSIVLGLVGVSFIGAIIFLLTRFGLFAFLIAIIFSSWSRFPLTTDSSSWYFPGSVVTMMLFVALATYGFIIAVGDQLKFKDPLSPAA